MLVGAALAAPHAADDTLRLGETRSFRLDRDAQSSYSVGLPAGPLLLVLDSRRADARPGPLQTEIAVRDMSGASVFRTSFADPFEVEHRGVARFSVPSAGTFAVEIRNAEAPANYWLTVISNPPPRADSAAGFAVPLFGDGQPRQLGVRLEQAGRLDKGEHAYFFGVLPAGVYDAALEFVNPNGFVTPLAGVLTLLDADGDTQETLVRLDARDVTARDTGVLSLPGGGAFLFKVFNEGGPRDEYYRVDFTFTLSPRSSQ